MHTPQALNKSVDKTRGFIKEFRDFAMRGNILDLAIGVIIGNAFGKIVSSIVADIVMPALGLFIGVVNLSSLKIVIRAAGEGKGELAINYGAFLQTTLDFVIIAFAIFLVVKTINSIRRRAVKEQTEAPNKTPDTPADIKLLAEIRDLLKEQQTAK